jgi:hypothetical protein
MREFGGSFLQNIVESCPVCQQRKLALYSDSVYYVCQVCGHHTWNRLNASVPIENDILDQKKMSKASILDEFKKRTTLSMHENISHLIDFGSASGRFLIQMQVFFKSVRGVELSDASRTFCLDMLSLKVVKRWEEVELPPDALVTFWHSLEHIPISQAKVILESLSRKSFKIIVSVPNIDSLQFKLFGRHWTYYDADSHVSQFSRTSLRRLLNDCDFLVVKDYFSWSYTLYGYLQGFANLFNSIHNYFYYRHKRGEDFGMSRSRRRFLDVYNFGLMGIFIIPSMILAMIEKYFLKHAVMTVGASFADSDGVRKGSPT